MRRSAARIPAVVLAAIALAACGTSYGLQEGGDASYDAIKRASDACKADGGTLQPKRGGDSTDLGDYECKKGGTH
jgi:predicted small secreted protein